MDKQKPFHITITDNETGEVIHDSDVIAILGALHFGEDNTSGITLSNCGVMSLAQAVDTVKKVIEGLYDENPELKIIELFFEAVMKKSEK